MKYSVALILCCLVGASFAQRSHLTEGDNYFNKRFYKEAIEEYKLALEEDIVVNKFYMTQQIARTYKNLFDYENAELWYSKLIALGDENDAINYLHYAQILSNNEKYDEARVMYRKYAQKSESNVEKYDQISDWAKANKDSINERLIVSKTNIETGSRSMGLAYLNGQLYYAKPQLQDFETKTVFYDLSWMKESDTVTFSEGETLSGEINHSFYEGTPFITADGNTMYYTANASEITKYRTKKAERKNLPISKAGENILKIYKVQKNAGKWDKISELNINGNNFNNAFPHVSGDGKHLYFASDREGGQGGYDIYRSSKINDSVWSEPTNLGPKVNSDLDEMYPFTNDTAFFYSSKGKPGFGGADVFWAPLSGINIGQVKNMGKPVNSPKDDFSFILKPNEEGLLEGYLSSNREGTHGYDHIYYFRHLAAPVYPDTIQGLSLNKITLKPIEGVAIILDKIEESGKVNVLTTATGADGMITLILDKNVPYTVTFNKEGFKPVTFDIPPTDREDVLAKFGRISLEPVAEKNTIIQIPNIYFDFDKASIRKESYEVLDNIVNYLNDNPDIRVELSAHTDARGSDSYNLALSQRRANSTVKYLIEKGIDKKRLVGRGYGEKKIQNRCKNWVKCSDEEHEFNRRVEMRVL